jgi:Leucine-rich repeat (LRR) protein
MFIKKDLRKIPIIFADAKDAAEKDSSDTLTELRLARRPAEFQEGNITPLCQPHYKMSLMSLTSLSLYDCQISTLEGIEFLAQSCPVLEEMNLGKNPLTSLPNELGALKSLKALWLDDCEIEGALPSCLYDLDQLQVLRMSNNQITTVSGDKLGLGIWKGMEVLCLDGNMIESVPEELECLTKLKVLMLR